MTIDISNYMRRNGTYRNEMMLIIMNNAQLNDVQHSSTEHNGIQHNRQKVVCNVAKECFVQSIYMAQCLWTDCSGAI